MQEWAVIRNKIRQVIFRHLQYLLSHALRQRPQTCTHNASKTLQLNVEVRVCQCPAAGSPYDQVCDIRIGGVEKAKACAFWGAIKSRELLRQEFQVKMDRLIHAPDRGPLAAEYPDVAALIWVLGTAEDGGGLWEGITEVEPGGVES